MHRADRRQTSALNILISDPDGSGHEQMRDLASVRRMPGIALSGDGMKADIEHSMEAGFSRHIKKPVDWQELKVAIQKIAAEQTSRSARVKPVAKTARSPDNAR